MIIFLTFFFIINLCQLLGDSNLASAYSWLLPIWLPPFSSIIRTLSDCYPIVFRSYIG